MLAFASQSNSDRASVRNQSLKVKAAAPSPAHIQPVMGVDGPAIQRKASCACGGGCPRCNAASNDLNVSQPGDPAEIQADQIADKVMRMAVDPSPMAGIHAKVAPRTSHPSRSQSSGSGPVENSISDKIYSSRGSGSALDQNTRGFMESRFHADFGDVRVHTGIEAEGLSRDLNAKAFTIGSDIYFGSGQYEPGIAKGNHLIAHELAHTLQQRTSAEFGIQKQDDSIEVEFIETPYAETLELHNRGIDLPVVGTPPPVRQQQVLNGSPWSLNGRRANNTKRAPGFTGNTSGTHITHIDVQINPAGDSTASLRWANMGNSPGYNLPASLRTSPGAGNCAVDCSDLAQSQQPGSHCTPLSPPDYVVQGFSPHLGSYPTATFVTWYNYDRGVAFHYYAVPSRPESHGCTRLDHAENGAEWIYDNSLPGITTVTVNRDASLGPGPMCWRRGSLIPRPQPQPGSGP